MRNVGEWKGNFNGEKRIKGLAHSTSEFSRLKCVLQMWVLSTQSKLTKHREKLLTKMGHYSLLSPS